MISIIYCTREHNQNHIDHLKKTAGHPKVQVIEYVNKGESLTSFYNRGLAEAEFDIVVFLHDDITIETKQWANKLTKLYESSDYGILGVAGTKDLPTSGRWWENTKAMYGRVWHTHKGKKFISKYSDDQGTDIENVITVDGVFFSVMKSRLKFNFDETVEGFHFYDIDFCFRNYLEGVKVGVHTNIVINHMSIGETNDEWEVNRIKFADKFESKLPVKIDKIFKPKHKFRVLLGCINFNSYTGSELHVYELAKQLVNQGCDVTICSNIGGDIAQRALKQGIKLVSIAEPPGYKVGDGQWQIMGPDGKLVISKANTLYRIKPVTFDIIHLNHTPVTNLLLQLYPEVPAICTIHSEVIPLEAPVKHDNIKKYIAIRPEIKDFMVKEHDIPEEMINVVYNPIDEKRFRVLSDANAFNGRTLFVGTLDYLRKETLLDLVKTTKEEGKELWIVGKENGVTANEIIGDNTHVTYHQPTWDIEKYIHKCDITVGILLGRTTIEGWMCGKPGWIYDVNDKGQIQSKTLHEAPRDSSKTRGDMVANQIIEEYKEILK
jgi:predicted Fe-Mo cluster-binding NifX family protein